MLLYGSGLVKLQLHEIISNHLLGLPEKKRLAVLNYSSVTREPGNIMHSFAPSRLCKIFTLRRKVILPRILRLCTGQGFTRVISNAAGSGARMRRRRCVAFSCLHLSVQLLRQVSALRLILSSIHAGSLDVVILSDRLV